MKIHDGPDGKKYVETGDYTVPREKAKPGIAGTEAAHGDLRKCPGCGVDQMFRNAVWIVCNSHENHENHCAWVKAWNDKPWERRWSVRSAYADAHWREFVKYEVGVDLGKEPSKAVGVLLTPESVGKAYRNGFTKVTVETRREGVYCVRGAYNHVGQAYWVKEDGKLADRCEAWAATFHNVKDKDLDLISEWDEKAEAGSSLGEVSKPSDDRSEVREAAPAQPEILPTWTDGDVLMYIKTHPTCDPQPHNTMADLRRGVRWHMLGAKTARAMQEQGTDKPDAPDRRAEHVPVAKAWVNPAMLGR